LGEALLLLNFGHQLLGGGLLDFGHRGSLQLGSGSGGLLGGVFLLLNFGHQLLGGGLLDFRHHLLGGGLLGGSGCRLNHSHGPTRTLALQHGHLGVLISALVLLLLFVSVAFQ
jgi:hypothetical protein